MIAKFVSHLMPFFPIRYQESLNKKSYYLTLFSIACFYTSWTNIIVTEDSSENSTEPLSFSTYVYSHESIATSSY